MIEVPSFALQKEHREKAAAMDQALVARYVPLMKAYERMVLEFNKAMAEFLAPYDAELEQIEQDYTRNNPEPSALVPGHVTWHEQLHDHIQQVFEERHPGVKAKMLELPQSYEDRLEILEAPIEMDKFVADGGTEESYHDLRQAVLLGIFSKSGRLSEIVERHFRAVLKAEDEYGGAAQDTADLQTPESLVVLAEKEAVWKEVGERFMAEFKAAGGSESEADSLFGQRKDEYYNSLPPLNFSSPN